jgi:16S rRNA (guanine527-N7)-methyltransferase
VTPVAPLPAWCEPARGSLERYAALLATAGVERGIIGPREVPRIWERHLVNCAVVAEPGGPVPLGASVIDVGSGGGLPGLVWAICRPDLSVVLLEPLLRRTTFLAEAVAELGLGNVEVARGRAEEYGGSAEIVTARAVAPLGRLAAWCLPLVRPGGALLALKGASVAEEIATLPSALTAEVIRCGAPPDQATVAVIHRAGGAGPRS